VNTEALRRIGELYVIEAEIRGKPPNERPRVRQERTRPLMVDFEFWLRSMLSMVSLKGDTAKAIDYSLNQWHPKRDSRQGRPRSDAYVQVGKKLSNWVVDVYGVGEPLHA